VGGCAGLANDLLLTAHHREAIAFIAKGCSSAIGAGRSIALLGLSW